VSAAVANADGRRSVTYSSGATPNVTYSNTASGSTDVTHAVQYGYTGGQLTSIAVPNYPQAGSTAQTTFAYTAGALASVLSPVVGSDADARTDISYAPAASRSATITAHGHVAGGDADAHILERFAWNPNGTCATRSDPATSGTSPLPTWTYTYASNNEQTLEVSPTGARRNRLVSVDGDELASFDEAGHRTANTFDEHGDLVRTTDPRGQTTYYNHDGEGNVTREWRVLDHRGALALTESAYETSTGLLAVKNVRISNTETATTTYANHASGQVLSETAHDVMVSLDPTTTLDITTSRTYNAFGEQLSSYDASGVLEATHELDAAGRVVAQTDRNGIVTRTSYDALGQVVETSRTVGGSATFADWTRTTRDASGRAVAETTMIDANGQACVQSTVTHTFDASGREVSVTDSVAGGLSAHTHYDARGNATQSWAQGVPSYTDAAASSRVEYDVYGRQRRAWDVGATDASSTTTYYPDGEVLRESAADGTWTEYRYDDGGNKIAEIAADDDSSPATSTLLYDIGGRQIGAVSADGAVTSAAFDAMDRQVSATGEATASADVVNALGWTLRTTDSDGISLTRTYDVCGRQLSEVREAPGADPKTTTTAYVEGRVDRVTDPDGARVLYTYDTFGRVTREVHETSRSVPVKDVTTTYDSLGRPRSTYDAIRDIAATSTYAIGTPSVTTRTVTYGGVTTVVSLGADGRESARTISSDGVSAPARTVLSRDSADRETAASFVGAGMSARFDEAGRLRAQSGAGLTGSAETTTYRFDAAGRKLADDLHPTLGPAIETTYTYTDGGRLATVTVSGTSTGYRFDDAGNLTWVKRGASVPETLTYDAASRLVSMSGVATTTLYTFDALGQRVAAGRASNRHAATYAYTGTGRLSAFDTSSGISARYTFDAAGQRTHSSVTSGAVSTETTYTYDGLTLLSLAAQRSDGATWSITYLYDAASRPYAGIYRTSESTAPTLFALVTTDRGDVTELLDASATPLVSYRYDAFGRPNGTVVASGMLAAALAERQILRYATYAWDAESATYYCSARTYDPQSAQFISKDPAKADGEESAYQYCGGDPVGKVDPSGLWAWVFAHYVTRGDVLMDHDIRLLKLIAQECLTRGLEKAAALLAAGPKLLRMVLSGLWMAKSWRDTVEEIAGIASWFRVGDLLTFERSDFAYYSPSCHQSGQWLVKLQVRLQRKSTSGRWSTVARRTIVGTRTRFEDRRTGAPYASRSPIRLAPVRPRMIYGNLWGRGSDAHASLIR
ncbi:MAG: RHS repeat-associated core domain-containing protein, partial [Coriobacteriia bacterium]|nr:RHS repeat-associated core domain-containing protein [Coriobacteriia bacterium]